MDIFDLDLIILLVLLTNDLFDPLSVPFMDQNIYFTRDEHRNRVDPDRETTTKQTKSLQQGMKTKFIFAMRMEIRH